VATSTLATPCTTTSTKVATPNALGYLDICTKGYHLAWASHQHPLQFKLLRRDTIHDVPVVNEGVCQLTGILRFLSSLTVRDVLWSRHYRYDCMGMLEYTSRLGKIRYRYDFFLVLYSKSVSCTPIYALRQFPFPIVLHFPYRRTGGASSFDGEHMDLCVWRIF
jgi:hypothetical protein